MKNNLIFILSLFFVQIALANTTLLKSKTRPSIATIQENYAALSIADENLVRDDRFNLNHFKTALIKDAPQFIVKLEKAHPEATFLFLGRDTQLIADVVDAFYLSIGQPNRVKQVGVSGPTLAGLNNKEVLSYLSQYGLSIENIKASKTPLILVDTISKGDVFDGALISGRQGRHILQIIYKEWIDLGHDPKELLKKVNMIGMQVSTFREGNSDNNYRYSGIQKTDAIHAENAKRFGASDFNVEKIGHNLMLPLISDTKTLFNEAGYDHYTATWHDKFQEPRKKGSKLIQNPGELMPLNYRWSVLWMQKHIVESVFTEDFKSQVLQMGLKNDVVFKDFSSQTEVVAVGKNIERRMQEILFKLKADLPNLGSKYSYKKFNAGEFSEKLTNNGSSVLNVLIHPEFMQSEHYVEISLQNLLQLYKENKIGARDFRRIFMHTLEVKPLSDKSKIHNTIRKNLYSVEPLTYLFAKESSQTEFAQKSGVQGANYNTIIKSVQPKVSCRYIYE